MGESYSIEGRKYILAAAKVVNEGVDMWIEAANAAEEAWMKADALSSYGKPAWAAYVGIKDEGVERLHAATNALIGVREALDQVAGIYAKAENESVEASKRRVHRPEIDDPRYGR